MPKLANIDWANNEVAWTIYNDLISIDAENENIHRNSFTDFLHSVICINPTQISKNLKVQNSCTMCNIEHSL